MSARKEERLEDKLPWNRASRRRIWQPQKAAAFAKVQTARDRIWNDAIAVKGQTHELNETLKSLSTDDSHAREVARTAEAQLALMKLGRRAETREELPELKDQMNLRTRIGRLCNKIGSGAKRAGLATAYWARRVWDGPSMLHDAKSGIAEFAMGYAIVGLAPLIAFSLLPVSMPAVVAVLAKNAAWYVVLGRRLKTTFEQNRFQHWRNEQSSLKFARGIARTVDPDGKDSLFDELLPNNPPPKCALRTLRREIRMARSQINKSTADNELVTEKIAARRSKIDRYYAWAQLANWESQDIKDERAAQARQLRDDLRANTAERAPAPTVTEGVIDLTDTAPAKLNEEPEPMPTHPPTNPDQPTRPSTPPLEL